MSLKKKIEIKTIQNSKTIFFLNYVKKLIKIFKSEKTFRYNECIY